MSTETVTFKMEWATAASIYIEVLKHGTREGVGIAEDEVLKLGRGIDVVLNAARAGEGVDSIMHKLAATLRPDLEESK